MRRIQRDADAHAGIDHQVGDGNRVVDQLGDEIRRPDRRVRIVLRQQQSQFGIADPRQCGAATATRRASSVNN